jgi:hypothetical protein
MIGRMNIANIRAICHLHPQTVRDILVHRIDEDSDRARMLGEKGSSWLTCLQELSSELSNGLLAWLPVEVCQVIQKSSQNHTYHSDGVEVLNVGGKSIHCQVWSAPEMLSKTPNLVVLSPFTVHFVVPGSSQFHKHEHSYSRHILG